MDTLVVVHQRKLNVKSSDFHLLISPYMDISLIFGLLIFIEY